MLRSIQALTMKFSVIKSISISYTGRSIVEFKESFAFSLSLWPGDISWKLLCLLTEEPIGRDLGWEDKLLCPTLSPFRVSVGSITYIRWRKLTVVHLCIHKCSLLWQKLDSTGSGTLSVAFVEPVTCSMNICTVMTTVKLLLLRWWWATWSIVKIRTLGSLIHCADKMKKEVQMNTAVPQQFVISGTITHITWYKEREGCKNTIMIMKTTLTSHFIVFNVIVVFVVVFVVLLSCSCTWPSSWSSSYPSF